MGPPETPSRVMQQSPSLFPSLQLSPDMYAHQFSAGPATAPIYPNERLFWDPANIDFNDPSLQQYQDPFQFSSAGLSTSFASSSTVVPSFSPQVSIPEDQPYDLPTMPRSASYSHINGSAFPAPFQTSPRMLPPQMENPSMFLSSPARRFGTADQFPSRFTQNLGPERPAYAHQIEESRREQELKRRRSDIKQPSITRSVMEALRRPISPKKDNRPGLQRSLTHTGIRNDRGLSLQTPNTRGGKNSPAPLDQNRHHRPGRSSPLKSNADPISRTLSASRNTNTKRSSLSLAIDENGVAKTVITKNHQEMDLDATSASDTESFDDQDFHMLRSQGNSFAFPGTENHSHAEPDRPYGHSKTSSHSTMASASSTKQSSYQGSTSSLTNTRGSDAPHVRRKRPVLGSTIENDTLMEDEPTGNAQYALRAILQDRSRSTSSQGDSSNQTLLQSSPPLQQGPYALYNLSPTTITDPDLATPSTDRESLASNMGTRCLCHSSAPDGLVPMVQW